MTKQEAREQMKVLRQGLTAEQREERDKKIFARMLRLKMLQEAEWFFPFVSYGTEVDTMRMIQYALQETKLRVAVPRVRGKNMDFYEITSMNHLKKGYRGILEPDTDTLVEAKEGIMLLPGLAFDIEKNRVGYGGGYYDRYLAHYPCPDRITIAVAYDFQIVHKIETDAFDQCADWIITDQRII